MSPLCRLLRPASGLGTAALVILTTLACAPIPPPDILGELDRVREAPTVRDARAAAPAAVERAELRRLEANEALEDGDFAGAQLQGERARASYDLAVVLARLVHAEQQRAAAQADAHAAETELAGLDAEAQRVAADVAALEQQLAALRLAAAGPNDASVDPAAARQLATAMRFEARVLCTAARLLVGAGASGAGAPAPARGASASVAAERALGELERRLGSPPGPQAAVAPALELRAGCLAALTAARRPADAAGSQPPLDALLGEVSALGIGPTVRDARGIVVTLRDPFSGDELTAAARAGLAALGRLARAHPDHPLLVVVHQASAAKAATEREGWQRRGRAVAVGLGEERIPVALSDGSQPLLDPKGPYAARNQRIEVVLVAPSLL